MIHKKVYPSDFRIPFSLQDEDGNPIHLDFTDLVNVKAYLKDENKELIRAYALNIDSGDTDIYTLIQDDDNETLYIWVTKEDLETIGDGEKVYIGVEVILTDMNVPDDEEINYVELIARLTINRW